MNQILVTEGYNDSKKGPVRGDKKYFKRAVDTFHH